MISRTMGLGIMNIGKKQRINESWEYMLEHNSQHYSQDISLHIPYIFSIFLKINLKKIRKKEEKKHHGNMLLKIH